MDFEDKYRIYGEARNLIYEVRQTSGYDICFMNPPEKVAERRAGQVYMVAFSRRTRKEVFAQWVLRGAVEGSPPERLARLVRTWRNRGYLKEYAAPAKAEAKNVKQ